MNTFYGHSQRSVESTRHKPARQMISMLLIVSLAMGGGACGGGGGYDFSFNPLPDGANRAPVLEPVPDQALTAETETSFTVRASDPEGDSIQFQVFAYGRNFIPNFITIENTSTTTALVTIKPGFNNEGVFELGINATDNSTSFINSDNELFTLTVRAADEPARSFYRLPILIDGTAQAASIGLGAAHSCMTADASASESLSDALCWGNNESGQLGFQSGADVCGKQKTACSPTPGRVDIPVTLVGVDGSAQHSCGLTEDGQAWCWGQGYGGSVPMVVPTELRFVELKTAPTDTTTCGLTETGQLYCWRPEAAPEQAAEGFSFTTFDLGGDFACGIDPERKTFCWGNNWYGQLGMGPDSIGQDGGPASSDVPVEVFGNHRFSELSLGLMHACGLKGGGDAYCWGYIVSRTGLEELSGVPQGVEGSEGFRQIASGDLFACGILRGLNAPAVCWGNLDVGRVVGASEFIPALRPVLLDPDMPPESIAAGGSQACAISGGAVYCWGDNRHAQLGRLPGGSP